MTNFIKTNDATTPSVNSPSKTQTHSGSGDNVAENKIGRQINMGSGSTYIENASNAPSDKPKDSIENLVANGKLSEALAQLATKTDDSTVLLLQSRLSRLERDENAGTMDARDANIERNRITNAILALVKDIT